MPAEVRWYACNLVTGAVAEELPLEVSGSLTMRLGAYSSGSATLGIPPSPAGWVGATEPAEIMLVLALDDVIVWGARLVAREGGTEATATFGLATLESYLDWRYVGDHAWTQQDEASVIAAGLLGNANTVEGIGLTVDAPATGTLRDRHYKDQDDKTVYSALRELMGVEGGPEWTIELDWTDDTRTAVRKTFKVRDRIGVALAQPQAVFQTHGEASATYRLAEDKSAGKYGNHVIATSSGEGDTRPQSTPARDEVALARGVPRYEHRFTPSTSITNISTLNAHAREELARVAPGGRVVTLTTRFDAYPRLGVDWRAGDDVAYELEGHRHPDGFTGVGRCVGWELDLHAGTVSPHLLIPGEEVV